MRNYGEFLGSVNRLEDNLNNARSVWTDQTAQTYDTINENIEDFIEQISQCYDSSVAGQNAVKANYNESEFNDELNRLNSKIDSV